MSGLKQTHGELSLGNMGMRHLIPTPDDLPSNLALVLNESMRFPFSLTSHRQFLDLQLLHFGLLTWILTSITRVL